MNLGRLISVAILLAAFSPPLATPQTSVGTKPASKTKEVPCEEVRQASYSEGWHQGADSVSKESWSKGFQAGLDLDELLYTNKVSDAPKVQNISIVVEDIDGATSFQFAAAEVVHTYFAETLVISPDAALSLHIGGTKSMALAYGSDVQSIDVEVTIGASQTLAAGNEKRLIRGMLQLASGGGTMRGYSQQEKTQAVREYIYKVLSEYKQKWDKAAPKDNQ
jgi:hypothetical protein